MVTYTIKETKSWEELFELFTQQKWFKKLEEQMRMSMEDLTSYPPHEWVDMAMYWAHTKEGFVYWQKIHNEWKDMATNLKVLKDGYVIKQTYTNIPDNINKQVEVKINKIGAEFESCRSVINKIRSENFVEGLTSENYRIKEAQIVPIDFNDFKTFLKIYTTIYKAGGKRFVVGAEDRYAGSMHLHISLDKMPENINAFSKLLAIPRWFQRKDNEKSVWKPMFRDAIYRRALPNFVLYHSSKEDAITINPEDYNKPTTIEFRINENALPLWVYFVPFMLKRTDVDFTDQRKYWFKIRKELQNWVNETYKDDMQRDILSFYIKSNLNIKKTYRYIKENYII